MEGTYSTAMEFLLIAFIAIAAYYGIPLIYKKGEMVFELDDRYYNLKDLRRATVAHLRNEGKKCSVIDERTLDINGEQYILTERTIGVKGGVVQQVVLKKCK